MSDTKKHKDQGKFHSGVLDSTEVCESTKQMWNRHNGGRGEFRKAKKDLEDKIAEKELKIKIKQLNIS
jgi:hypothetical protein